MGGNGGGDSDDGDKGMEEVVATGATRYVEEQCLRPAVGIAVSRVLWDCCTGCSLVGGYATFYMILYIYPYLFSSAAAAHILFTV